MSEIAASNADPPIEMTTPTPSAFYRQLNSQRFTIELEFFSSLSNPTYLVYLHSLGHFHSPSFLRYLAYLHQTWSQPNYIKFVRHPISIQVCKALVKSPDFRNMIGQDGWEGEMTKQITRQWAGNQTSQVGSELIEGKQVTKVEERREDQDLVQLTGNGNGNGVAAGVKIELQT